mmetsp:Transcript_16395/g.44949  ORF Transcript_16395/g.44949 Transcript_16395/m.44949 type:complete len:87 (-) Transcript_16395:624-884(-)|eukprot:560771-Pelagomonas_calceolata.AAC.2
MTQPGIKVTGAVQKSDKGHSLHELVSKPLAETCGHGFHALEHVSIDSCAWNCQLPSDTIRTTYADPRAQQQPACCMPALPGHMPAS